jgi:probable RNA-binding protein EIF1AD
LLGLDGSYYCAQVEFPDGHTTLCLLPAKFHKKLWIKKGNYLIIEDTADADARVTGQILAVLFADHVKQLKRMQGVW